MSAKYSSSNSHPQSNGIVKGVNDCSEVLQELCQKLVRLRVFPYYLHHTDSVKGNHHFVFHTVKDVKYIPSCLKVSGLALPRYVIDLPDGRGKVDMMRQ